MYDQDYFRRRDAVDFGIPMCLELRYVGDRQLYIEKVRTRRPLFALLPE